MKRNDGKSSERLAFVGADGKTLSTQSPNGAFGGYVDVSVLEKETNNSVVLTHNYSMSSSFSDDDLNLLMQNPQIKTIVAAGHDGTVYRLSIGKGERVGANPHNIKDSLVVSEFRKMHSMGAKPDDIVKALSQKYNWKYEVK